MEIKYQPWNLNDHLTQIQHTKGKPCLSLEAETDIDADRSTESF